MTSKALYLKVNSKVLVSAVALIALIGCDENGEFSLSSDASSATQSDTASAFSGATEERDVEAPEVFQVTENGLWDGRPSLGGVWVAHPDVTDPERVIIRNEANGKFVIGALFRRERDNPGPSLQVSSDAAQELGMLAGSPARLNVTALRREAIPVASDAPTVEDVVAAIEPSDIAQTPLDPIAGAAAAIEAAEAPAVEVAVAPPAPAPAPRPASSLEKPFIQVGIFSVETNANNTATALRGDGILATVLSQESQGRAFWRVVVGPLPSVSDRAAALAKVKELGFGDAYFVTN